MKRAKYVKKVFTSLLLSSLILMISASAASGNFNFEKERLYEGWDESYSDLISKEEFAQQKELHILANKIDETFSPKDFGGSYYDDDGALVINLVGRLSEKSMQLKKFVDAQNMITLKNGIDYKTKVVAFTLQELVDCYNKLGDNMKDLDITFVGRDEKNGYVEVRVDKLTQEIRDKVAKVVDLRMVFFKEKQSNFEYHVNTVMGGTRYTCGNGGFTAAWGATYNGTKGFLITGHHGQAINSPVCRGDGKKAGKVTFKNESGKTDFCL